ncbi:hypothetical protein B5S43_05950 [Gilliamella apicola]|uniref:hypothetical protein n=1 Tax=Gilliamella apicola TaxID=1196095 RepID=UPI000A34001D|nr:hypothetical protein [Gilliamella apicola]OTQ03911.1 hypothetical protein B5S43_05950 [Gilliamella apicola]OTQ20707.1 hypothetical protein B6D22_11305 [Gilliamella apicola]
MENNITRTQGIAITNALNEYKRFTEEVEVLKSTISDKIKAYFDKNAKQYKIDSTKYTTTTFNNGWFCEWTSLSVPISKMKAKKGTKPYGYLSFQLCFSGETVFDKSISKKPFPLIHIIFWGEMVYRESYFRYPVSESEYFDEEEPGKFIFIDNENKHVLYLLYDEPIMNCWTYSVELMKINSKNIEDILFKPAVELLESNQLILSNNKALDGVIIEYPPLENFIIE